MNLYTLGHIIKGVKSIKNLRMALMALNIVSVSADIYIKLNAIQKEKKKASEETKKRKEA